MEINMRYDMNMEMTKIVYGSARGYSIGGTGCVLHQMSGLKWLHLGYEWPVSPAVIPTPLCC